MADILIKDFPMNLNGHWGACSDHIIIHGNGSVTDTKGRAINNAKAVQVVRCRDCEVWQTDWNPSIPDRHYCAVMDSMMKADDFCSYGERREG